jgi:hypothetical protein
MALTAWSSGIVSGPRGDWSYESWYRIPPGYRGVVFYKKDKNFTIVRKTYFSLALYTLVGIRNHNLLFQMRRRLYIHTGGDLNLRSSVPNAWTLTTSPRRQGFEYILLNIHTLFILCPIQVMKRSCHQIRNLWMGIFQFEKQLLNVCVNQGDQMSLWKNRPRCSPTHSMSKLMHILYNVEK